MSNSRRSLLAAGLAAAVVGATGVVWTLSADAAENPEAGTPPAAVAPAAEDAAAPAAEATAAPAAEDAAAPEPVPPKLLPWGEKPHQITVAKAGASSAAVAAAGADAAPADTSGSMVPEPEYAPKGLVVEDEGLESTSTTIVPPAPPGVTSAAPAAATKIYFNYASGGQQVANVGTWASMSIHKPKLAQGDAHTLAELAVSKDGQHVVEVGWNVDRTVNGDDDPHLFVFYWKGSVPKCYNCQFTQRSKTVKPGDTLPQGTEKRFGIQHTPGYWWIAYDSEYVGYFPDSVWEGQFTSGTLVQWFGEVASPKEKPCTAMGNGLFAKVDPPTPTAPAAAKISSITVKNAADATDAEIDMTRAQTDEELYKTAPILREPLKPEDDPANTQTPIESFRYGGPGKSNC